MLSCTESPAQYLIFNNPQPRGSHDLQIRLIKEL